MTLVIQARDPPYWTRSKPGGLLVIEGFGGGPRNVLLDSTS